LKRNLREVKGRERKIRNGKNGERKKEKAIENKEWKQEQNKRSNKLGYVHMPDSSVGI
jgi:hypothetical protein